MIYVMSDIHGQYDMFMKLMEKINFNDNDKLYILGDAMDRGSQSAECMEYIINHKNIEYFIGNHDVMFMNYYDVVFELNKKSKSNTNDCYDVYCYEDNHLIINSLSDWRKNGMDMTVRSFKKYGYENLQKVYNYLLNCSTGKKITVNGTVYYLSHSKYIKKKMKKDYLTVNLNKKIENFNKKYNTDIRAAMFQYANCGRYDEKGFEPEICDKMKSILKIIDIIYEINYHVWYRPNWNESKYMKKGIYIFGHTMTKKYKDICEPYIEINGFLSSEQEFRNKKPRNNALVNIDTGCALISANDKTYIEKYKPRMTCLCLDNFNFYYVFPDETEENSNG